MKNEKTVKINNTQTTIQTIHRGEKMSRKTNPYTATQKKQTPLATAFHENKRLQKKKKISRLLSFVEYLFPISIKL